MSSLNSGRKELLGHFNKEHSADLGSEDFSLLGDLFKREHWTPLRTFRTFAEGTFAEPDGSSVKFPC